MLFREAKHKTFYFCLLKISSILQIFICFTQFLQLISCAARLEFTTISYQFCDSDSQQKCEIYHYEGNIWIGSKKKFVKVHWF